MFQSAAGLTIIFLATFVLIAIPVWPAHPVTAPLMTHKLPCTTELEPVED